MSRAAALARALAGYRPHDSREAVHRARMLELACAGDAACAATHFDPGHFTASAFVLSPEGDALLEIFHAKLERWLQPGGHVEAADRSLVAAARREVAEETGLDPGALVLPDDRPFDLDVHPIPARGGQPAHEHFDVRFRFRATRADVRAADGARDVRWRPLAGLLDEPPVEAALRRVAAKLKA